jgi:carbamoylphosphate synthase large subunit
MANFAKLIQLEKSEQVLVTMSYNDEDDVYEVLLRTDFDNCVAQIKMGFAKEKEAKEVVSTYTKTQAILFRKEMSTIVS